MTSNKFWLDVIGSLEVMWQTDAVMGKTFIKNTPIWLNPLFSVPINRQWFKKGISKVSDFLGTMNVILPMDKFMEIHGVKTNFLDYHFITGKIKTFIEWKDLPLLEEDAPKNSSLNNFLNQTRKGVSKIYSQMKASSSHVLDTAVAKWCEKTDFNLNSFEFGRSFHKHHLLYKDTYLKYIQFRTLHHRFYTNEKLFKMGIKKSSMCGFCHEISDSIEHMFLECHYSQELWGNIQTWIRSLGMDNYNLSSSKIILGDLENANAINTIILMTKKVLYNCMKKEQRPNMLNVKNEVKKFYFEEKYRCYLKGKGNLFEKQFNLLSNIYCHAT